jgi:hypothetical protein
MPITGAKPSDSSAMPTTISKFRVAPGLKRLGRWPAARSVLVSQFTALESHFDTRKAR